jgi:hypothetical protein
MRALALILLLFVAPAFAGDLVVNVPGLSMKLQSGACADAVVLRHLDPQYWPRFKAGETVLDGKPLRLCWIDEGEAVYVKFEDGSGGRLPKQAFKEQTGV